MEKLHVESEIPSSENKGVTLKNQRHRFQLVIKNLQAAALYGVSVEILGELAPFTAVKVIDSIPAEFTCNGKTDDYYLGGSGIYPDVIRPLLKGDILLPPNGNRCLWVSVEPNGDLPVGKHKIGFRVFDDKKRLMGETEYELDVLDFSLNSADIKKTNWMHYDCICNAHNVEPFTADFYKVFENYLAAYTRAGFNMLLTPLFTPPLDTYVGGERRTAQLIGVSVKNGVYSFDFTALKKFLRFVLARGIKYIEFSHLFTQWGGECCAKVMATVNGETKKIFGWENDSRCEEYKAFLNAFLPELVKFIKQEKIEKICCFHLTDEPHDAHVARYKELREVVKSHIGDMPTIDALSNYEYCKQGLVDLPVPGVAYSGAFFDNNVKDFLVYYCCEPSDGYYSNRFINMPSQRTRIIGAQLYLSGVIGFLHWGFNFYNSGLSYRALNPYAVTNGGGALPPGDGFIVYPEADGVNISLRGEMMALAFEDYDLLYTLEKKVGREKVVKLLKKEKVNGFTEYPRDAVWHNKFITKIKKELAK